MTTVAVMQPYFLPYAGYFRLFAAADLVALLDCVQFPRRGWVHRNRLPGAGGVPRWLTLPLAKAPMAVRIADLAFAVEARESFRARCRVFPILRNAEHPLAEAMMDTEGDVVLYLARLLALSCEALGLPYRTIRTSELGVPPELRGQDRVLEIARRLGARRYVNLAGGRVLYDPEAFAARGIELAFLNEWRGSMWSILYRLLTEPASTIAAEIRSQT